MYCKPLSRSCHNSLCVSMDRAKKTTYPNPRERPVMWSCIICASLTGPYCSKYALNSTAVQQGARLSVQRYTQASGLAGQTLTQTTVAPLDDSGRAACNKCAAPLCGYRPVISKPSVVSGARPPTKIFRALGFCSCGTDFLASICTTQEVGGRHHRKVIVVSRMGYSQEPNNLASQA